MGRNLRPQLAQLRGRLQPLLDHELTENLKISRIVNIGQYTRKARHQLRIVPGGLTGRKGLFQRPMQDAIQSDFGLLTLGKRVNHLTAVIGLLAVPTQHFVGPRDAD